MSKCKVVEMNKYKAVNMQYRVLISGYPSKLLATCSTKKEAEQIKDTYNSNPENDGTIIIKRDNK